MPLFDYVCTVCHRIRERLVDAKCADTQRCDVCGQLMIRRPGNPSFTIKGYAAKNGYSAVQTAASSSGRT